MLMTNCLEKDRILFTEIKLDLTLSSKIKCNADNDVTVECKIL